ncbi:hypothetical protein NMS20_002276 [Vibrio cholerae]|nr:hypothetical protein [Vibrio cholerae]
MKFAGIQTPMHRSFPYPYFHEASMLVGQYDRRCQHADTPMLCKTQGCRRLLKPYSGRCQPCRPCNQN